MKTPLPAVALLAASLLLAPRALHAQGDAPAGAPLRSKTTGLLVGLHFNGSGLRLDDTADEVEADAGGGVGVIVGYGLSGVVTLFLNVDVASLEPEAEGAPEYGLMSADLGARFHFGAGRAFLVPYVELAATVPAREGEDAAGEAATYGGAALTAALGVQRFFSRRLALDGSVRLSVGGFTHVDAGGEYTELEEDVDFTALRVNIGVAWRPGR